VLLEKACSGVPQQALVAVGVSFDLNRERVWSPSRAARTGFTQSTGAQALLKFAARRSKKSCGGNQPTRRQQNANSITLLALRALPSCFALGLSALAGTCAAQSVDGSTDTVRFSGFGSLGVAHVDASEGWVYRRELSQPLNSSSTRLDLDSRLGLQVNYTPSSAFELVGQAILAYFSDRGRPFQADRGRQDGVAEAALGKRAGTGLNVAQSSTISLKRAAVGRVSGVVLSPT
jgi:hypothetical protein